MLTRDRRYESGGESSGRKNLRKSGEKGLNLGTRDFEKRFLDGVQLGISHTLRSLILVDSKAVIHRHSRNKTIGTCPSTTSPSSCPKLRQRWLTLHQDPNLSLAGEQHTLERRGERAARWQ